MCPFDACVRCPAIKLVRLRIFCWTRGGGCFGYAALHLADVTSNGFSVEFSSHGPQVAALLCRVYEKRCAVHEKDCWVCHVVVVSAVDWQRVPLCGVPGDEDCWVGHLLDEGPFRFECTILTIAGITSDVLHADSIWQPP